MRSNVARGHGRATLSGLERIDLHIQGTDDTPFLIVECRPVDGARQVVQRKLSFTAGVNDAVKLGKTAQ